MAPPWIIKVLPLDRWLPPTTGGGGSLPAFRTDSYFSCTLLPGHHNFFEIVLIEPDLAPALSEATRAALAVANIRYVYTYKDIAIGMSPDEIRQELFKGDGFSSALFSLPLAGGCSGMVFVEVCSRAGHST